MTPRLALAALALTALGAGDSTLSPPVFRAGFVERDITPEVGMEAPGGYGKAHYTAIHDPCKVRASVFDDGRSRVAIVGVDALGIRRDTVQKVRRAVAERTGIPAGSILIAASHSHSSGPLGWTLPGEYDDASPLVRKLAYEESTLANPAYVARVERALVDAITEANDRRVEARGGVGKGIEPTVAFNRRFRLRDGRTITHPGQGNPDIVEPAGPADPDVGVVGAWDAKDPNRLLGCVVHFACHATTNPQGGAVSANYIYYLEKVIKGYYGNDAVVVFLPGASGDITQVDNRSPTRHPDPERWAQRVGGKVGAEALKVLLTVEPGALTPVAAVSKVWEIPRRAPRADRVKSALAIVEAGKPKADPTEWTFAKETVILEALIRKEPRAEVEVQAVQVGPAVFVSDPAEYFCRFGLEIKAASGLPFIFPVSLANGCVGYVPTEEAFAPDGGGYETRLTSYSNLDITAGTQLRDAGMALARTLKPGPVPAPPAHAPFGGEAWTYGDVGPQKD
jgi:neutral ceramidase